MSRVAVGPTGPTDAQTVGVLRRALLVLAAAGVLATAIELAMLRHWGTISRNLPWAILGVTAIAIAAVVIRPTPATLRIVRVVAVAIAAGTVYGIVQHIIANHEAGPLDARYAERWTSMSASSQWWAAATESVGPSPPLAPVALVLGAVCLWLATLGRAPRAS